MRQRYKWLIGLLVLFGAPYCWLLIDNRPGAAPTRTIDIAELRRLGDAIPGAKPESVHVELVGWRRLPGTLLVAGGGLKRNLIGIQAFVLRGPWGDVAIDSGLGTDDARRMHLERYRPADQAKVDRAVRGARLILFTHEHPDHLAGVLRLPDFARIARRALLPPEQGPGGPLAAELPWPPQSREAIEPFRYGRLAAVAPGVVMLRTPGHTPGSQMIYVRLEDGREYLFAGDTATMARSFEQVRARSRLVSAWIVPEDRTAVFGWLKGLKALSRAAPEVFIVPGHDYDYLLRTAARHRIALDFEVAPPPPRPPDCGWPSPAGSAKRAAQSTGAGIGPNGGSGRGELPTGLRPGDRTPARRRTLSRLHRHPAQQGGVSERPLLCGAQRAQADHGVVLE